MNKIFVLGLALLLPMISIAQKERIENPVARAKKAPAGMLMYRMTEIKWVDAPSTFPDGVKMAVLEGDPKKEGLFTMRIQIPPYTRIQPHTHSREERVTVVSGMVFMNYGAVIDTTDYSVFTVTSFYINPPHVEHYLWTRFAPAILQITGMGPWDMLYVKKD